jgi:hypothetical protein
MAEDTKYISASKRSGLLLLAWFLTAVATIPFCVYPIFFPVGLGRFFLGHDVGASQRDLYILYGWPAYIVLTLAACFLRRRWIYFIVYFVLCLLLALNCIGCRECMSDIGSIKG